MTHLLKLNSILFLALAFGVAASGQAEDKTSAPKPVLKIGIIGLDTSHAPAFTTVLNDPNAASDVAGCRVVCAYPKGSPDIESSVSRVPKYTEQMKKMGVEIVPSIDALLERVDCVLLLTNDGRPHLEQVLPVLKAGKRVFIDKPIAASLADTEAIFAASKETGTPLFSSSSLRFGKSVQAIRNGSIGEVTHCETYGPCFIEKTHPDLFWYGIHGVEILFTAMGTGCESVQWRTKNGKIEVVGTWSGGRTGIYRDGKGYGGIAKGSKGTVDIAGSAGYHPLIVEIVRFFRTGTPPVTAEETLELVAFMEAADESKRQGGKPVRLDTVGKKAR